MLTWTNFNIGMVEGGFNDKGYFLVKRKLEEFLIKCSNFDKILIKGKNSLDDFRKLKISYSSGL